MPRFDQYPPVPGLQPSALIVVDQGDRTYKATIGEISGAAPGIFAASYISPLTGYLTGGLQDAIYAGFANQGAQPQIPLAGTPLIQFTSGLYRGTGDSAQLILDASWQTLVGDPRGSVISVPLVSYARNQTFRDLTLVSPSALTGTGLRFADTVALTVASVTDAGGSSVNVTFNERHHAQNTAFAVLTMAAGAYVGDYLTTQILSPYALKVTAAYAGNAVGTAVLTGASPNVGGDASGLVIENWDVGLKTEGRAAFKGFTGGSIQYNNIGWWTNHTGELRASNMIISANNDVAILTTRGSINFTGVQAQKVDAGAAGWLVLGDDALYGNHPIESYPTGCNFALGDSHRVLIVTGMAASNPANNTGTCQGRSLAIAVTNSATSGRIVVSSYPISMGVNANLTVDQGATSPQQITISGTTDYNAVYNIQSKIDSYSVEVLATYTSGQSGTGLITGFPTMVLLSSSASAVDDFYRGYRLKITSGTGSGQSAVIQSYVGATGATQLRSSLTPGTDATSTYQIVGTALTTSTPSYCRELYPNLLCITHSTNQDGQTWIAKCPDANTVVVSNEFTTSQTAQLVALAADVAMVGRKIDMVEQFRFSGGHASSLALENVSLCDLVGTRVKADMMIGRNVTGVLRMGSTRGSFGADPYRAVQPYFPYGTPHGYGEIGWLNATGVTSDNAYLGSGGEYGIRVPNTPGGTTGRAIAITSIADAGGGLVRLTLATPHFSRSGGWPFTVTISGTSNYNGTFVVQEYFDFLTLTIKASYVGSQTGTCTLNTQQTKNWNGSYVNGTTVFLETAGLLWRAQGAWGPDAQPEFRAPTTGIITSANTARVFCAWNTDGTLVSGVEKLNVASTSVSGARITITFNRGIGTGYFTAPLARRTSTTGAIPSGGGYAIITESSGSVVLEARDGSDAPYASRFPGQVEIKAAS